MFDLVMYMFLGEKVLEEETNGNFWHKTVNHSLKSLDNLDRDA